MKRKFTEQELVRRHKLEELRSQGIEPYSGRVDFSHYSDQVKKELADLTKEQAHDKKIKMSVIGRIMTKRGPFIVIKDAKGSLQGYFNNKENQKLADFIAFLDLGDIVWIEGYGMKTNTNEATIHILEIKLLSKSLRPLPEKYHSITDKEEKQRRRYVDLIMNDETRARFWTRTKIIKSVRKFFDDLGYMEADTPILHGVLGGAAALPFITKHNALNMNFYLRIATELPLKRLIVGGMERVYEIGRLFRNEGVDSTHNPEFTTIEFYEANSDLSGMMSRTEDLLNFVASELGLTDIEYNCHKISFKKPFKRITMRNAIKEKTGVDFYNVKSLSEAKELADKHEVHYEKFHKVGHIVSEFFGKFVEHELIQPTFVTEFPIEISPLAKKIESDPEYTDRSELFIVGKEYANMFTELNDPIDQYERFESQQDERKNGNKEANEMDIDFVEALEYGLPPTGGCGVGIDRLVMLLTGSHNITDIILFPHLKHRRNE